MAQVDLSSYESRQALRDQGYYVGDDGSGGVVVEKDGQMVGHSPGPGQPASVQPASASSGQGSVAYTPGGGQMGALRANDGQTLSGQSAATQAAFRNAYGDNAEQAWAMQHNAAIGQQGGNTAQTSGPATGSGIKPAVTSQTSTQGMDPGQAELIRKLQGLLTAQSQGGADRHQLELDRLDLERQRVEMDRIRAESDMQLARNADSRAEATLRINQAQQALQENQFARAQVEFDRTLANRQQEFQQSQYTDLANTLLTGASGLRGPRDWVQYSQFTGGGKSLHDQLFSGQSNAAFGGERGPSPNITVGDVMGQLGFVHGAPPQQAPPSNVPLPHQINPMSWDSMADDAKQLTMGLAEGGYTSRGVYTPADYERILNASRPQGTASRATRTTGQRPVGAF